MEIEILHRNNFPIAQISLDEGESFVAERSTFVGMSPTIQVETKIRSGQIKSYIKEVEETQAYYLNTFTALENPGRILLAPRLLGEIYTYNLSERENRILITNEAFLGAHASVSIETAWRGANTFQMSAGMNMLSCSGEGKLLLCSFGAVERIELKADESFAVDKGHLVGFTETVQIRTRQMGGIRSTLLRGREILVEMQGPGVAYLQTRSQEIFLDWLNQFKTE